MAKIFVATQLGYDGAKRVYPGERVMLDVEKAPSWALTEEEYAEVEANLKAQAEKEALAAVSAGLDGQLPGQAPQPKKEPLKGKDEKPAEKPAEKVATPVSTDDLLDQNANTVKKSLRDGEFTKADLGKLLATEKGRESPRGSVVSQIEELLEAADEAGDGDDKKSDEELADG